jgi:hypothetical protein
MTAWKNKMCSTDLNHGELEVFETMLDFHPYSAVVEGVPDEVMCKLPNLEHDDHPSSGSAFVKTLFTAATAVGVMVVMT